MVRRLTPSRLTEWPEPFDTSAELDWGRLEYSRRLLREHLDQSHDGASRRRSLIAGHVRRLRRLLPPRPARLLDAGCGPGLYAVPLAAAGYDVTGVDISPAALRHARRSAAGLPLGRRPRFQRCNLRNLEPPAGRAYDAALLIYFVLEAFPRAEQPAVLRRVRATLRPEGRAIVEMRLRPDQLPGRLDWWHVVDRSLLSDRRHLLLGDSVWDPRRHTHVLRELAVHDDGSIAVQQTSGWLCPFERIPALFRRGGFAVERICDGWSADRATPLSETVLVVARRRD